MQQKPRFPPFLQPAHFKGLELQLTDKGLRYSARIGHWDRETDLLSIAEDFEAADKTLDHIQSLRDHTKVVLNPPIPSAKSLLKNLQAEQKAYLPDEKISVKHGLPSNKLGSVGAYSRSWFGGNEGGDRSERQHVVLVAYSPIEPVGYIGMELAVTRRRGEKTAAVHVNLPLIYVAPRFRGQGYGLDLSIAAGAVSTNLLEAVYRAVPSSTCIRSTVTADYESKGGEAAVEIVYTAICYRAEVLNEERRRPSIVLETPGLDAGY